MKVARCPFEVATVAFVTNRNFAFIWLLLALGSAAHADEALEKKNAELEKRVEELERRYLDNEVESYLEEIGVTPSPDPARTVSRLPSLVPRSGRS